MTETYNLPIKSILGELKVRAFNITKKFGLTAFTAVTQTVLFTMESVLDLELTHFCLHCHITPAIREFHDNDDVIDLIPSPSFDIEEESKLIRFTQALQNAQIIALKNENKHRKQAHIKLASKGYISLHEYTNLKGIPVKLEYVVAQKDPEKLADEAKTLD